MDPTIPVLVLSPFPNNQNFPQVISVGQIGIGGAESQRTNTSDTSGRNFEVEISYAIATTKRGVPEFDDAIVWVDRIESGIRGRSNGANGLIGSIEGLEEDCIVLEGADYLEK
ncbi:hypothetical protein BTUL_0150g00070 [Botrytis tulipae]|uniref:Uncharacterized protein n=1 Tax=Botrytis tulipae TaxID=87230 RepID=A0A4Z1EEH6_9HELO|nr:hypothetical protein BTUL_0150g00070 [Botrytis tulipae]